MDAAFDAASYRRSSPVIRIRDRMKPVSANRAGGASTGEKPRGTRPKAARAAAGAKTKISVEQPSVGSRNWRPLPMPENSESFDTTPFWTDTGRIPRYPRLAQDLHVDVAIIGGGITGITAA